MKLKDALLEYLRQWRPNSTEMMTMLTLRFHMEREHGQIIEEQAERKLKEIKIRKPGLCGWLTVGPNCYYDILEQHRCS